MTRKESSRLHGLSRTKGRKYAQWVARKFRPIFTMARRGLQDRDGSEACDVEGTPYWIECKHGRRVSIPDAMDQAVTDAPDDPRRRIVICRIDRRGDLATMRLDDLLWLIDQNERLGDHLAKCAAEKLEAAPSSIGKLTPADMVICPVPPGP